MILLPKLWSPFLLSVGFLARRQKIVSSGETWFKNKTTQQSYIHNFSNSVTSSCRTMASTSSDECHLIVQFQDKDTYQCFWWRAKDLLKRHPEPKFRFVLITETNICIVKSCQSENPYEISLFSDLFSAQSLQIGWNWSILNLTLLFVYCAQVSIVFIVKISFAYIMTKSGISLIFRVLKNMIYLLCENERWKLRCK